MIDYGDPGTMSFEVSAHFTDSDGDTYYASGDGYTPQYVTGAGTQEAITKVVNVGMSHVLADTFTMEVEITRAEHNGLPTSFVVRVKETLPEHDTSHLEPDDCECADHDPWRARTHTGRDCPFTPPTSRRYVAVCKLD